MISKYGEQRERSSKLWVRDELLTQVGNGVIFDLHICTEHELICIPAWEGGGYIARW